MSQIVLSDDLVEITAEINSYKQVAGQAVFEIGKRLKHVKDNDLAHGQWYEWLKSVDVTPQTATRMVQAYEQFGNRTTSYDLPTGKIFEMLSLPESVDRQGFIEEAHTVPSTGEQKTVDEMTVKELREVKKALQEVERAKEESDKRAEQAKHSAHHFEKLWNQAKNQPPIIQTKTVAPSDYEELRSQANEAQQLRNENVKLQRGLIEQRAEYESRLSKEDKNSSINKELRKGCKELLQNHGLYAEAIIYSLSLSNGEREAAQIIEAFQMQYSQEVQSFFNKIKQMTAVRSVG
ncbi:DUF3102 domain-containing protein [Cohnella zeiphila]|uniref:DUF3102 domain-containing protein n=1 Tax=Cohnella zeiphila TaxID=2761120 RepID=A0A7X0SL37_9BACL|nr:DUF3102 domain-containing protein [Cohnella zeiphila]MBB6731926.1 DUF3102 domain-containing protein [Cohnella zeiphila]